MAMDLGTPWRVSFLSIRRYANFYLPPRWFWGTFGQEGHFILARQILMWLLTIPGMVWLPARSRIDSRYRYVLAAILGCSLVFIFVQPMLRYRYFDIIANDFTLDRRNRASDSCLASLQQPEA